ncbi:MAG: hypothetical protein HY099_01265 [Nitrospirae bacterium]|nr:hypothetical protein [Nitrospirota bacterium]
MSDKKIIVLIVRPFIMAAVAVFLLSHLKFKPSISRAEKEISTLSYGAGKSLIKREPLTVSMLDSPIEILRIQRRDFPKVPLSQVAPPAAAQEKDVVTFILIDGGKRMAIINGIVVKEGDIIKSGRVARIEKDRVLIKDKKESRWLTID